MSTDKKQILKMAIKKPTGDTEDSKKMDVLKSVIAKMQSRSLFNFFQGKDTGKKDNIY